MKIIIDTREKQPWDFRFFVDGVEQVQSSLKFGDYTTSKLKDVFVVERKANTGEIYHNLGRRELRRRFYAELNSMNELKHAYVICEFPERDIFEFPKRSSLPQNTLNNLRVSKKYFTKLYYDTKRKFPNVNFRFFEDRLSAEEYVFDKMLELEALE